jgi:hypothetical protein
MNIENAITVKSNDPCDPDHIFQGFRLDAVTGRVTTRLSKGGAE